MVRENKDRPRNLRVSLSRINNRPSPKTIMLRSSNTNAFDPICFEYRFARDLMCCNAVKKSPASLPHLPLHLGIHAMKPASSRRPPVLGSSRALSGITRAMQLGAHQSECYQTTIARQMGGRMVYDNLAGIGWLESTHGINLPRHRLSQIKEIERADQV